MTESKILICKVLFFYLKKNLTLDFVKKKPRFFTTNFYSPGSEIA